MLSADRPKTDPKDDFFGHAPFAKHLASSLVHYGSKDGIVLALYGPWGSGKSTILGYICHYLKEYPEHQQPVVIHFNPWWFSGQENLTRAYLSQLEKSFSAKGDTYSSIAESIAKFAEGMGTIADLSGKTGGMGKHIGKIVSLIFQKRQKDLHTIKEELQQQLQRSSKRVIVILDDIDRLLPDETRQIFTVIKSIADFPNVTYLLAFDREIVSNSIKSQCNISGDKYIDKIIQVPFEIPPIDRISLRKAFLSFLAPIITTKSQHLFNKTHWTNVYFNGVDKYLSVPRDIIRLCNTISITYPQVESEVNPVDFIAIESIRVFLPKLYYIIKNNPSHFTGYTPRHTSDTEKKEQQEFINKTILSIPEHLRSSTMGLLENIFPKLSGGYGVDWLSSWRKNLNISHPDIFPTYFRLSLTPGFASDAEMKDLLKSIENPESFHKILKDGCEDKRPDGQSKTEEYFDRIMDYIEKDISSLQLINLCTILLDIGDDFIIPSESHNFFEFSKRTSITRPIYHALKRLKDHERVTTLRRGFENGNALAIQGYLINVFIEQEQKKQDVDYTLPKEFIEELKSTWSIKTELKSHDCQNFLSQNDFSYILFCWLKFDNPDIVKHWTLKATVPIENLVKFISRFSSKKYIQQYGNNSFEALDQLDPRQIEDYLDINQVAQRLKSIPQNFKITDEDKSAINQFLLQYEQIQSGVSPDDL